MQITINFKLETTNENGTEATYKDISKKTFVKLMESGKYTCDEPTKSFSWEFLEQGEIFTFFIRKITAREMELQEDY